MVSRKIDKALHGPSLAEVVLGVVLSLILGAACACAYLVLKPVAIVKEMPKDKERVAGMVYYLEGSNDATRGKQWMRKKQLFLGGSSVTLNEDELNAWITAGTAASNDKGAPAAKPGKSLPAPPGPMVQMDVPNFRMSGGMLQIGTKGTLNLDVFGVKRPLVVQASGRFVKRGGEFVFAADQFYVGSFPMHKIFGSDEPVLDHLIGSQKVSEDIVTAWKKLVDVSIEGNTLKLSMP
ncbi:MAG TPA: hypothetical protein VLW52_00400 [Opitutaceae bacterium]|nr:hypothetical protein [Opitutaceae bacterium]